jgi:KUP system potassium uptake protein
METSFFIARQIISTPGAGMMPWREHLFVTMSRNAHGGRLLSDPEQPGDRTGTQVEI